MKEKVIGLNPGYLLKYFLLYNCTPYTHSSTGPTNQLPIQSIFILQQSRQAKSVQYWYNMRWQQHGPVCFIGRQHLNQNVLTTSHFIMMPKIQQTPFGEIVKQSNIASRLANLFLVLNQFSNWVQLFFLPLSLSHTKV